MVITLALITLVDFDLKMQLKNFYCISDCWSRDMQKFDFYKKGPGTSFSTTFYVSFFMIYSNWPNFVVCLPLLLEILVNMYIVIIFCPICSIINSEINHSFLIKTLFYIIKKSGQKCKNLKNKNNFQHEIKSISHNFKGLQLK